MKIAAPVAAIAPVGGDWGRVQCGSGAEFAPEATAYGLEGGAAERTVDERKATFESLMKPLVTLLAWARYAWGHVFKMDQQTIAFCVGGLLVFCLIWWRIRKWLWRRSPAPENPQLKLLKAVEARVYENELLHERLIHQAYRGKLLKKEMRWLRECLYETRQRLEELRGQQGLSSGSEWWLGARGSGDWEEGGGGGARRLGSESAHGAAEAHRRGAGSRLALHPRRRPRCRRRHAALSRSSRTQPPPPPPRSAEASYGRHQEERGSDADAGRAAPPPPPVDTDAAGDAVGATDPTPNALVSLFMR